MAYIQTSNISFVAWSKNEKVIIRTEFPQRVGNGGGIFSPIYNGREGSVYYRLMLEGRVREIEDKHWVKRVQSTERKGVGALATKFLPWQFSLYKTENCGGGELHRVRCFSRSFSLLSMESWSLTKRANHEMFRMIADEYGLWTE